MKKIAILTTLLCSLTLISIYAQNNYRNIENFKAGTVLLFQDCETDIFETDPTGRNVIWDYSGLKQTAITTTQWMVVPDSVREADDFPETTLIEKYSDGRSVFLKADKSKTYLLGFTDEQSKIKIRYPQPVLIAKRPFSYDEKATEPYTTSFTVNGMELSGKGVVSIEANGFGTLILPNKTYQNTLRIKIIQKQSDTLKQYNSTSETTVITYVWFDKNHSSALLKMTETKSQYHSDKRIEYLISETVK